MIAGGWSSEREVSLAGARNIEKALADLGHEVNFFDLKDNFGQLLAQASAHDFAFINLHGRPGEDGLIQAMLDSVGCPYQGSGAAASFLALNKSAAKQIFRFSGIPTADWEFLAAMPDRGWRPSLPYPLFVKSNTGGSSLHLAKVGNREELKEALEDIFEAGDEAIIEPLLPGKDLTCGILGEEALPPILIEPLAGGFFDYQSKYAQGGAREICPAPVSREITLAIQKLALQAHKALGLRGYSRADFILDDKGALSILEVNTLPGMTATSLVPQEAKYIGLDFGQLLERLIELGLADHGRKN